MKNILFGLLSFITIINIYSQANDRLLNLITQSFYDNGKVSIEEIYKKDESYNLNIIRTYYKSGELEEVFYFKNGNIHGNCFRYDESGKKITTWEFKNGVLIKRIDHKLEFTKKTKEKVIKQHIQLKELNKVLNGKNVNLRDYGFRANIRASFGNKILALKDYEFILESLIKLIADNKHDDLEKSLAHTYDALARINNSLNRENQAAHFYYSALKSDSTNTRIMFNLGAFFYKKQSYKLALQYFNKVIEEKPNHEFAHRSLATYYSYFKNYKKAKYHVDIAFENEKKLIKHGYKNLERDIWTIRGWINHKLGASKKGILDLKKAIRLNKKNSYANYHLGLIYYDLGNYNSAYKFLNRAKKLNYELKWNKNDIQPLIDFASKKNKFKKNPIPYESENNKKIIEKYFVYPNPSQDFISVKNYPFKDYSYRIFNFLLKVTHQGESTNNIIDISKLKTGIYKLEIYKNNEVESFWVIKKSPN